MFTWASFKEVANTLYAYFDPRLTWLPHASSIFVWYLVSQSKQIPLSEKSATLKITSSSLSSRLFVDSAALLFA